MLKQEWKLIILAFSRWRSYWGELTDSWVKRAAGRCCGQRIQCDVGEGGGVGVEWSPVEAWNLLPCLLALLDTLLQLHTWQTVPVVTCFHHTSCYLLHFLFTFVTCLVTAVGSSTWTVTAKRVWTFFSQPRVLSFTYLLKQMDYTGKYIQTPKTRFNRLLTYLILIYSVWFMNTLHFTVQMPKYCHLMVLVYT